MAPKSKIGLQIASCNSRNEVRYRRCINKLLKKQEEEKNELKERLRKNESDDKIRDVKIYAGEYLSLKTGIIRTNAVKVQNAINNAKELFQHIIQLKDLNKLTFVYDLIWSVGSAIVPGIGAGIIQLRSWRDAGIYKRILAETARRTGNVVWVNTNTIKEKLDAIDQKYKNPGEDVIRDALRQVERQLDLADVLSGEFLSMIKNGNIDENFKIEDYLSPLGKYAEPITTDSALLSKMFLYNLLKAYAERNCWYIKIVSATGRVISEEFIGLSQSSRYAIFDIFGFNSGWVGNSDFPAISDYRDILAHWNVKTREEFQRPVNTSSPRHY